MIKEPQVVAHKAYEPDFLLDLLHSHPLTGEGLAEVDLPSARQVAKRCIALFPQNWGDSGSFVEVIDDAPQGARLMRIDRTTKGFT